MDPVTVYLGLGSNLGQRDDNLGQAVELLAASPQMRIVRSSSIYETEPWGYTDQPCFLNCVVEAQTTLAPAPLLELAKDVEQTVGRQHNFRWGPRLIDVDILLYGDQIVSIADPDLQIPHARLTERAFVLTPLSEIAPQARHPASGHPVASLARQVKGAEGVKLWAPPPNLP